MRKLILYIVLVCGVFQMKAQQYPFFTQYRSNALMLNPAVAGTRRTLDVRMNYRNQWVGFEGAPTTMGLSVNASVYKDKMGVAGFIFRDALGPSQFTTYALSYAFHLKFKDTKLSIGLTGNYNVQNYIGSKITTRFGQDRAVDNTITDKDKLFNMAFGLLYYNDKFYVGAAMNNVTGGNYEFYKLDEAKKAIYTTVPHYNFSVGYNYNENPDYLWENSLIASYVSGLPILLDYNTRMHIKGAVFVGAAIRFKTAIVGQVGYTFKEMFQVSYSYDYNINRLRTASAGTHEIKLVYNFYDPAAAHRHAQKGFIKKHYPYLL